MQYSKNEALCGKAIKNNMLLFVFVTRSSILQYCTVLKPFSLQSCCEKVRIQIGAALEHFPLQILYEEARLQIGAVLKQVPLQILYEKL